MSEGRICHYMSWYFWLRYNLTWQGQRYDISTPSVCPGWTETLCSMVQGELVSTIERLMFPQIWELYISKCTQDPGGQRRHSTWRHWNVFFVFCCMWKLIMCVSGWGHLIPFVFFFSTWNVIRHDSATGLENKRVKRFIIYTRAHTHVHRLTYPLMLKKGWNTCFSSPHTFKRLSHTRNSKPSGQANCIRQP